MRPSHLLSVSFSVIINMQKSQGTVTWDAKTTKGQVIRSTKETKTNFYSTPERLLWTGVSKGRW